MSDYFFLVFDFRSQFIIILMQVFCGTIVTIFNGTAGQVIIEEFLIEVIIEVILNQVEVTIK